MFLNQSITVDVSFHWLTLLWLCTAVFILSKITLLILPILDLQGFISRQLLYLAGVYMRALLHA